MNTEGPSELVLAIRLQVSNLENTLEFGGPYEICAAIDRVDSATQRLRDLLECSTGNGGSTSCLDVIVEWGSVMQQVVSPTERRKVAINARLKDKAWASSWKIALKKIPSSPFLTGKNNRGWKANIDWFLRPDSVFKILEGQYDGAESGPSLGDLISQKRALDDEIHNHRENRDGPAFRFGRSTPEGREEFAALKAKREEVTRRISSMNGPA